MPRHISETFPGLEVHLETPNRSFLPGQTITGLVIYKPVETDRVNFDRVDLTFHGRAKSLIADGTGHGLDDFRGRRILCEVRQQLHRQDVPPMEKEYAWPFAVDIPLRPNAGSRWGDEYPAMRDFLSTDDVSAHTLPSTFYNSGEQGLHTVEAFIEYYLQVDLHEREKVGKYKTTILPVVFRQHADAKPLEDLALVSRKQYFLVKTTRLLAADQQPSGSREKMKYLFKPSKVPAYAFHMVVDAPSVIQLDHPEPMPFRLCRVHTAHSKEKTTIDGGGGFPDVVVKSVHIQLRQTTLVRAPTVLFPMDRRDVSSTIDLVKVVYDGSDAESTPPSIPFVDEKEYLSTCKSTDLKLDTSEWPSRFPTRQNASVSSQAHDDVPPPPYNSTSSESNPSAKTPSRPSFRPGHEDPSFLDLGRAVDLILVRRNTIINGKPTWRYLDPVFESFESYNVSRRYHLVWNIEIECEGEKMVVGFDSSPVRVLAECERMIRRRESVRGRGGGGARSIAV